MLKNQLRKKYKEKRNTISPFFISERSISIANKVHQLPIWKFDYFHTFLDGIEVDEEKIQVVFIPLLAFDLLGNRVGYGKGYYDTFLKNCNDSILKIGLSLFEAEKEIIDIHENDVPLNFCVTPEQVYEF